MSVHRDAWITCDAGLIRKDKEACRREGVINIMSTVNDTTPRDVPDNWILWRIAGRKHHEVVTHVQIDGEAACLCGVDDPHMVMDYSRIFMPPHFLYSYMGGRAVLHRLCRRCINALIKREG